MSWSSAKKTSDDSKDSAYLKLKDKDRKQIVLMSEPVTFFAVFGEKGKEYRTKVPGSSFKFKVLVVELATGEGKIWSGGSKVLDRIAYLDEEMGPINKKVLIVGREGNGKDDTTYNVDVKGDITPEIQAKINAAKLPKMESKNAEPAEMPDDLPPPPSDDIPF